MSKVRERLNVKFKARPNLLAAMSNLSWLLFDKIIRVLGGIFVGAWVARHLGPQDYGQLSYVLAYIGLFAVIVSMGLNGPVVRSLVNFPAKKTEILGATFTIQMFSGLFMYLVALIAASIAKPGDSGLLLLLSIYGISLIFKSSDVVRYLFESQVTSKYAVISDNFIFIAASISKIMLILYEMSLVWFVWLLALEAALYATALFAMLKIKKYEAINFSLNMKTIQQLVVESFPVAISSIFVAINLNADKLILGQYFSSDELGIYAAASVIVVTWFIVPVALGGTVAPRLNKIHNENIEIYKKYVAKLYVYIITGSVMIAIFVSMLGGYIIYILYGPIYERSHSVLTIMIWSIIFISIVSIRGRLLIIEGKQKMIPILTFYGAVINLVLCFLIVPKYGANGAAVAFLSSWIVSALIAPLFHSQCRNHAFMALCISKKGYK